MSFQEAIRSVFRNYANFKGRARRKEYWYFSLFTVLVSVLIYVVALIFCEVTDDAGTGIGAGMTAAVIFNLAMIIPSFSVCCRRLHDVGKPGSYLFFFLIPIVGEILIWVWAFQDGEPGENIYGEDPKHRDTLERIARRKTGGAETVIMERCPHCGAIYPEGSCFCPKCGQPADIRAKEPETRAEKTETSAYTRTRKPENSKEEKETPKARLKMKIKTGEEQKSDHEEEFGALAVTGFLHADEFD